MKFTYLVLFMLAFSFLNAQDYSGSSVITDDLLEQMNQKSEKDLIRINIRLTEQYDINNIKNALLDMDKEERRYFVINELKAFRDETQKDILNFIEAKMQYKQARLIRSLWITNTVTCVATKDVIDELAIRSDIDRIDWDEDRKMLINDNIPGSDNPGDPLGGKEITWNVTHLNVTDVWALGFDGTGVIVGVLDTGVNYNHLDLQDHMWTDPGYPNHGYDFTNNDNDPMDDHGHGTHCAGTVAGDGTAGSQTGMAPEATIIALKVLDAGGSGNESDVWAAIQFIVDNNGDVISMSLGWQHSWGPDRVSWRNSFDNALAAGVISAVAAGNEGDQQGSYPIPDNVRTPGDCPPPWLNPDQTLTGGTSGVVCIGATDISDNAASFTSEGPVTWEAINPFNDYSYPSQMGLIRPDVAAPGVNIKSLSYSSNTGYADGWSGTSMATPAVAGVMALMLDKNPNLTPIEINMALETTALDLGSSGKDNIFGAGRINGLAAVNAVPGPGPVYNAHTIDDSNGNNNGEVEAGESILLSLEMINNSTSANNNVTVNISTASPFVTITDNTEYYGNFVIGQIKNINDGFAFDVATGTPGVEDIQFAVEATNGLMTWNSQFSIITSGPNLEFGNMTIDDASGNGNGRLDPGETADITFPVLNIGNSNSPFASALLSSVSAYVTINSGSATLGVIDAGGSADAVFNITCDGATPIGTAVDLTVDVEAGDYDISNTFYQSVGLVLEDWETGTFFAFPWTFAGTADWVIDTSDPYEGTYCAKSGTISHNQTSELVINVETTNDDYISFYRKVSSEGSYDYLQFWIDGTQQEQWSGEAPWAQVSYFVPAGVHTFKWVYNKDGSVNTGSDCGWVDYIIFPSIVPPPDPPDIDLSALSFEVTVPPGGNTTEVLTIANVGEADLDFSLSKYYLTDGSKAYCSSVGGGGDEFIQNVTIGTINNTTGQSYYADYTAMSTVVNVGESYPITITNGDPIWTSDQCGIWVDWNQNED
ncbi:MAG: S8 family serine peptidase, partial [Bacteroidales bacterium]|nr:S8 family serine peptidase [Bacteroidales bacterium]